MTQQLSFEVPTDHGRTGYYSTWDGLWLVCGFCHKRVGKLKRIQRRAIKLELRGLEIKHRKGCHSTQY